MNTHNLISSVTLTHFVSSTSTSLSVNYKMYFKSKGQQFIRFSHVSIQTFIFSWLNGSRTCPQWEGISDLWVGEFGFSFETEPRLSPRLINQIIVM